MANEITLNASLSYDDSKNTSESLGVVDALFSVATKKVVKLTQNISHSAEVAIKLGDISAPAYAMFVNRDPTNYVELKVATSGAIFAKLRADPNSDGKGGVALLELGSGAQVPYAIADTGDCLIDIFIISL